MKRVFEKVFIVAAVCLLFSNFGFAQSRSKKPSAVADIYVITAKAGGVNYISGNVSLLRQNGTKKSLTKGVQIEAGDTVQSSADGRAEILLNPGSFVRLAENSELGFVSNSLDDLRVKVLRGSAIFEVVATKDFKVVVTTPKSGFDIIKSGIYRVDVDDSGTAKIEVWKGKAQLTNATTLKGGQTSTLGAGQLAVAKFDRDDKDAFELWSKDRAKELAKLNAQLIQRQMSYSLTSYSRNNAWNNNGFGLWILDPLSRSFCFLPFGYGYNSPYGYGYNRSVWENYYSNPYNNSNNNNSYNSQNNSYNPPPGQSGNSQGNNGNTVMPPTNPNPPISIEPPRPIMPSIIDRKMPEAPAEPKIN